MGRIIGVVILLIGVIIAFYFMPDLMTSTHDVLTDEETYAPSVTTAGGVTSSDLFIARGLYNDDPNSVIVLTSSDGNDTPVASSYSHTTQYLTVTGLAASTTRTLSLVYEWEATGGYTGMTTTVELAPTLIVLAILMIVIGGMYFGVRQAVGGRGGG